MAELRPGQYYGATRERRSVADAILSEVRHPTARKIPAHTHENPYFCLLLDGAYREFFGKREIEYQPLSVVFHPEGMEHWDEVGSTGALSFLVDIGRNWRAALEDLRPRTCVDLRGGPLTWLALSLHRSVVDSTLGTEEIIWQMLAATRRERPLERTEPRWLRRVDEVLDARFAEVISIETLAAEAGVHPVHLARTYRRFRGRRMFERIHALRLQYVCRAILEGATDLTQLSSEAGFADQSHLTRIAGAIAGASPAVIRRQLRGLASHPRRPPAASEPVCPPLSLRD